MNTNRFTQLLESKLGNVKPLLIKEMNLTISPYILTAENGNVSIINTKTKIKKIYSLKVKQDFGKPGTFLYKSVFIDLKVIDFPGGDNIKIKAVGIEKEEPLNTDNLLALINSKWNQKEFDYTTKKGSTIRFTQEVS